MAVVIPFRGLRPQIKLTPFVVSRSVANYTSKEIQEQLQNNPLSFLQILHPEFGIQEKTKPDSPERLKKIKAKFNSFIENKTFIKDKSPHFYIYKQKKKNHEHIGIIGCSSIDDYLNGVIKIHEQTISDREKKLKEYLDVCSFDAEPVLFFYPENEVLNSVLQEHNKKKSDYTFTTDDSITHQLWIVSDRVHISKIKSAFEAMPALYIGDGHHRSAASALYGKNKRNNNPAYTGQEAFNFYLGIYFSESQLKIYDYNRAVSDLHNHSEKEFLTLLKKSFIVDENGDKAIKPKAKRELTMYLGNSWYLLRLKPELLIERNEKQHLDTSILNEYILNPLLGITNLKKDKRVRFIPGIQGSRALKKIVKSGECKVAFGLYPISFTELKYIADSNKIMPPKSTWIEPKLRSGLVIYDLED
jgi:uncharacterized protein (DUF1015 family)